MAVLARNFTGVVSARVGEAVGVEIVEPEAIGLGGWDYLTAEAGRGVLGFGRPAAVPGGGPAITAARAALAAMAAGPAGGAAATAATTAATEWSLKAIATWMP